MNITKEHTGSLTGKINIEINEQDYLEKFQLELKNFRKRATLPGFRPGKVPQGLIEKKYGPSILAEEVNKLISEGLDSYIKQENLHLLGYPLPVEEQDSPDFVNFKNFNFSFDYALIPQFEINLSESTEIEYNKILVGEDILKNTIKDVQNQFPEIVEAEEITQDVKFRIDVKQTDGSGNTIEDGINLTATIDLSYIKDDSIKNLLTGLRVGDSTIFNPITAFGDAAATGDLFKISVDKAYQMDNDFRVEIVNISRSVEAEVNQNLFEKAFPGEEIKEYDEFVERLKKEIRKSYEIEEDKLLLQKTLNKLVDDTNIDLPDEFTKRWLFVSNDGKISKETIEKEYPQYRQAMIVQLVENELRKQHPHIIVNDLDIKNEVKRFYSQYFRLQDDNNGEQEAALDRIAENFMKNKEEIQKIHDQLSNQRLIELFKSKLKLQEKEISVNEFTEMIRKTYLPEHLKHYEDHEHEHDHDHDHQH